MKNKSVFHPKLSGYQLEDSRLLSVKIDDKNRKCIIKLNNVLFYGDKRIDKSIPVNSGNIIIELNGVERVDMDGEYSLCDPEMNTVYQWCMLKEEELFTFCLFVLVGHRHYILQATHSETTVNPYYK